MGGGAGVGAWEGGAGWEHGREGLGGSMGEGLGWEHGGRGWGGSTGSGPGWVDV